MTIRTRRTAAFITHLALITTVGALSGCAANHAGDSPAAQPGAAPAARVEDEGVIITIDEGARGRAALAFSNGPVKIAPGTRVTWINKDSLAHSVTSNVGVFDSGKLETDAKFAHVFTMAGTYHYYSSLDGESAMQGIVEVRVGDAGNGKPDQKPEPKPTETKPEPKPTLTWTPIPKPTYTPTPTPTPIPTPTPTPTPEPTPSQNPGQTPGQNPGQTPGQTGPTKTPVKPRRGPVQPGSLS